jgi:hypothetical protein
VVPFGAGIGKIIKLGKLPLNGQVSGYYNAIRPDNPPSPDWQLRIQLAFLFPTAKPKVKSTAEASGRLASPPGCPVAVAVPQR